jgi:hypothetical protein
LTITIDNLDGNGAVDYSAALWAGAPLTIERALNVPSRCGGTLVLEGLAAMVPVRRGRVVVSNGAGTALFTGYLATEPVAVYEGAGVAGPVYRWAFDAISDEWLLDKLSVPASGASLGVAAGAALQTLTGRVGAGLISGSGVGNVRNVGVFQPIPADAWSANAGALAGAAYGAYRVVDGALTFSSAGSVTHALSDGDGSLSPAALAVGNVKDLANDVTLTGENEPAAYVTEMFAGDGTTAAFVLSEADFKTTAAQSKLIVEPWDTGVFDPAVWAVTDPGSHLGFGAGGLVMTGGNGYDGQTTLTAIDAIEMGGCLVIEAGSVVLTAGSDGVLCGLFSGSTVRANCFAGYNVRQSGGATLVTPMLNGAEVGTSFTALTGHTYTFRIRLHCVEVQRVQQTYYARVDGAVEAFGGGLVSAPMGVVFELVDLGLSSNTPATVLYDTTVVGPVNSSPASCTFCAVDAVQMFGSMGFCRVTQTGSAWVVSTLASGETFTRLIGVAGEGVDCKIGTTAGVGLVTFFAGRVPVAGETFAVSYRRIARAVARIEDAASVAAEAAGGSNGTARWLGRVVKPQARSSADCESAALAVLSFATARAAALSGSYKAVVSAGVGAGTFVGGDVWPGDVLALTVNGGVLNVIVRKVAIVDGHAAPEVLGYKIAFANDWAEGLGLSLSEAISTDIALPATAATGAAEVLANLQQLAVISATGTALQVDAGTVARVGGGFEVRFTDGSFGPGVAADLVLRSPVRSFSIPRVSAGERYFVRMYDGNTPPLYSRWSSAVFCNLPVA